MKLDNKFLAVGDSVYDLAFGLGAVQSITAGSGFQVRFAGGLLQAYNEAGVGQFPNKTLYTKRPEIITPLNDKEQNERLGRLIRVLHNVFGE